MISPGKPRMAALVVAFTLAVSAPGYAKSPGVGDLAPPFTGVTLDGKDVSLDSLRGNVVILNFWATWCGPCKKELPLLDAYARIREKNGFKIVAVTTDADRVPVKAIRQLQDILSFSLLKKFKGNYAPIKNAIPTSYIIDREGVVRYAEANMFTLERLDAEVLPLLKDPPPPETK
jgi:cytochrome c biogenesis protein CcmG/thiol:disulfide interchange protein DsbE